METIRSALPTDLKHHPSEYVMGGRYYQSIEMSEGEKVTNMVADIVGEHVLMYASDYPHGESAFPESTNIVLRWNNMSEERKRKLFWDNHVRFYARCGL
jgi:predicted TIM-barrel fold metal-dependent hydrolase